MFLQVYVSYDYGKSFKKISERFSFGDGNSSAVAIAQFYHSPADNQRVRRDEPFGVGGMRAPFSHMKLS